MQAFRNKEMNINEHDAGHIIKLAVMPIYGKNLSKIFIFAIDGPISTKLSM